MDMRRILILRGGALGDFLLTLPVLCALRGRWPAAGLDLVGREFLRGLIAESRLAERFFPLDAGGMAPLYAPGGRPGRDTGLDLPAYDLVLCYLQDADGVVAGNLRREVQGRLLCVSPAVQGAHAADYFLRPLAELGISAEEGACGTIPLLPGRRAQGEALLREFGPRVAVLHPGSGSPSKNWPLASFVRLAELIRGELGIAPVAVLGEAEEEMRRGWQGRGNVLPVLPEVDLVGLAGVVGASALYAGNDSGVTHLAAVVGTPTVAIFGPTFPALWAPRGPSVRVVASPERTTASLHALAPEAVWSAVREWMGR